MTMQNLTIKLKLTYRYKLLAIILFLMTIYFFAAGLKQDLAIYWLVGISTGFTLQRSRLCFASGFRDIFLMRQGHTMKGILVGLGISIIGFSVIMSTIYPVPNGISIPNDAHILPVGLATITGGLLFGIGMVLAGGCVSGSLYRMGEGYLTSWVTIIGVTIGTFLLNQTWNWWWDLSINTDPLIWLPNHFGYGPTILISLALIFIFYLLIIKIESSAPKFNIPIIKSASNTTQNSNFLQLLSPLYKKIFKDGWSPIIGATTLGFINILLFIKFAPLGVVGEISRWGSYAGNIIGYPIPPLKGLSDLAGCSLEEMVQGAFYAHNSFFLNSGIIIGSFSGAVIANEFKLRISRSKMRYTQSLIGGVIMGYGAGLAIGCTIGAFFSAIPSLALSGWLFAISLLIGAYIGSKIITKLI